MAPYRAPLLALPLPLLASAAAEAAEPVRTLDLSSLFGSAPTDIAARPCRSTRRSSRGWSRSSSKSGGRRERDRIARERAAPFPGRRAAVPRYTRRAMARRVPIRTPRGSRAVVQPPEPRAMLGGAGSERVSGRV
jgi:hypothetical protein